MKHTAALPRGTRRLRGVAAGGALLIGVTRGGWGSGFQYVLRRRQNRYEHRYVVVVRGRLTTTSSLQLEQYLSQLIRPVLGKPVVLAILHPPRLAFKPPRLRHEHCLFLEADRLPELAVSGAVDDEIECVVVVERSADAAPSDRFVAGGIGRELRRVRARSRDSDTQAAKRAWNGFRL